MSEIALNFFSNAYGFGKLSIFFDWRGTLQGWKWHGLLSALNYLVVMVHG